MATKVNPTDFRKGMYDFIKQVSESGEPVEIHTRDGAVLQLARMQTADRFARIVAMPHLMKVSPDELVSVDWSQDWDADAAVAP